MKIKEKKSLRLAITNYNIDKEKNLSITFSNNQDYLTINPTYWRNYSKPVTYSNRKKVQRDLPKINENIHFPKVRVIDSDGDQLGILKIEEANRIADERELDLVLVSETADPPVCRIMDYGKFKFEQEKKARAMKKKQHSADLKEVKMRYKIDEHDYQVRVNQAKRFLKSGDKVKATINFRGREAQHVNLGYELLNRLADDLSEMAEIQQKPKKEGRNMIMLLSPKKSS